MTDPALPTDEQLVERAVRDPDGPGGRKAASELFERHQRRIYLWCYRYLRNHERALELAQETMLSAYRSLASFEGRSRFTSWLFVIARNRCLNAVTAPALLRDESTEPDQVAGDTDDPARRFEENQDEDRLRQLMIQHLDASEREALWLRCFERMPVEEIGEVMRLDNVTGARALLQRARRKLRAVLEREHLEERP